MKKSFAKRCIALLIILSLAINLSGCIQSEETIYYTDYNDETDKGIETEYDEILDRLYEYYNEHEDETDFTFEEILDYYNSVYGGNSNVGSGKISDRFPELYEKEYNFPEVLKEKGLIREHKQEIKGENTDKVTVMVYINGSDLESMSGSATLDIKEMLEAELSDNVNVVIQTGGTKKWYNTSVSAKSAQRFVVKNHKLKKACNDLGQLNMTDDDTLSDFIRFCKNNYPADRNILVFWNHGGGPVYGYGYDEYQGIEESMTLGEIQDALKDGGVYFDFIGFDACLMATVEVGYALCDYADYLIASENFESGYGWEYKYWLSALGKNSSISTPKISKMIIDNFVLESQEVGENGVLSLIDLSYMKLLYKTWTDFAYKNKNQLLSKNYSNQLTFGMRLHPKIKAEAAKKSSVPDWMNQIFDFTYYLSDYNVVDLMAVASVVNSSESRALKSAINSSVVYSVSAAANSKLTGISATLPYGETEEFYDELKTEYKKIGLERRYISFLGEFTDTEGAYEYYDWKNWRWDGWDKYEDNWGTETNWQRWARCS